MRPFGYISLLFLLVAAICSLLWLTGRIPGWYLIVLTLLYSVPLVLGAVFIRWNFYLRSIDKGNNPHWISLTFDDGPAAETAAILDILKEHQVPAAFFSIGKGAAAWPELVMRWQQEGHLIGNHSYHHGFHFDWQSPAKMAEEIERTNETIFRIAGVRPRLFRPPYGVTNPNLAKAVRQTGMVSVAWNIRSFDTTAKDSERLLARILDRLKGGDIILLHDSMPVTREILTELILRAREKGFTFVRLDQMLGTDAYV